MNIQNIKNTPITSIMTHYHFAPAKCSGDSIFYFAPWRQESNPSLKVSIKHNLFIDFGDEKCCGSVIDLMMNLENCDFREAVYKLEKITGIKDIDTAFKEQFKIEDHPTSASSFTILNEGEIKNANLIDYIINERMIPIDIAKKYLRELEIDHYPSRKKYSVLGMKNNTDSWEIRGSHGNFKSCIGKKDFTFFDEGAPNILVVEGMFDLLSAIILGDKICSEKVNYLVLHSLSNLDRALPKMLEHHQIFLALDLDFSGKMNTKKLVESDSKFNDLSPKYQMKDGKDLNDYLRIYQRQNRNRGRSI